MALIPPRFIPPSYHLYALYMQNGGESQQYGTTLYRTEEEALQTCEALQEAYQRYMYDCTFFSKPALPPPRIDLALISVEYR